MNECKREGKKSSVVVPFLSKDRDLLGGAGSEFTIKSNPHCDMGSFLLITHSLAWTNDG